MWQSRKVIFWAELVAAIIAANFSLAADGPKIELAPQVGPSGIISSIAYSPDGKLAVSGDDNVPKLWDIATGTLLRTFKGHTSRVRTVAFSPDGTRVLSGGDDKVFKLWDATSGKLMRTFEGKPELVTLAAFSPDGTRILSGGGFKATNLWDASTGTLLRSFEASLFTPQSAAFSSDGSQVLAGFDEGSSYGLKLWQASTGELLQSFKGHTNVISAVAFSPNGERVLSGSWDGTAKLWDLKTGRLVRTFKGPSDRIETVAFTHDGTRVLAGCDNGHLVQWAVSTGARLHTAVADKDFVSAVALSPDGKTLLSGGRDGALKRWDLNSLAQLTPLGTPAHGINSVVASPDGVSLLSASSDGTLKVWELETGHLLRTMEASLYSVKSAAISPDGARFLSGDTGGWVKLWDATTGAALREYTSPQGWVFSLAFSPNGQRFVSGLMHSSTEDTVRLWDANTGVALQTYKNAGSTVAFSPDGARFAISGDKKIKLYDATSGSLLLTLNAKEYTRSLLFSPNGSRLTSGAEVWDANTGVLLGSFGGSTLIGAAAFSADGAQIALGDWTGTVSRWDVNTGRLLNSFDNTGQINSISFAKEGRWIVSGSNDGVVRIWDLAAGRLLVSLLAQPDGAWLAITPEGFFAGSLQGTEMLSVVRGLEVYGIEQFYQALYRPDLVREKLAGDPRGLVRDAVASLDLEKVVASGKAPDVQVIMPGRAMSTSTSNGQVSVRAEITDRGGGVGRVEWRVNGVTAGLDTPVGTGPTVVLSRNIALDPGDNEISVTAYNSANLIASVPSHINVATLRSGPTGVAPNAGSVSGPPASSGFSGDEKPRLFVLAAGVNAYADKRIALQNAVADAREVARAFEAAGSLYQSVTVKLLVDSEVTSDKLDTAFKEIASKAQVSDVFVLYLAGHGRTVAGRYFFAPQNLVIDGDVSDMAAVNASAVKRGISQELLQRWFALVPARKSVILFDTCDSGTLAGDAGETQQLERGAANDRLAQATGRSIITASAGSQEAQDGYRGHGLFTYQLLDGFNRGDGDGNGTVEVSELAAYVYAKVTDISQKEFRQRQVPQMKITANYPLIMQMRVLDGDTTPVAEAMPNYQVAQVADVQIEPSSGAAVVRSLSAKTAVRVLQTNKGWSLVAIAGKPVGYVATRDLAPIK